MQYYRESYVIYDKEIDGSIHKWEVARTIAKAMVRQSLITTLGLLWWSHLWFNEGLGILHHVEVLNEVVLH